MPARKEHWGSWNFEREPDSAAEAPKSQLGVPPEGDAQVTKRALVKALSEYEGTIVFVSHDRAFHRAIATRILELSAKSPHVYGNSCDEYVATTEREAPGMRQLEK